MSQLNGYLAPDNHLEDLVKEISLIPNLKIVKQMENLVITEGASHNLSWCQNQWIDIRKKNFNSVSEAANYLSSLGRFWSHYGNANFRRGELIASQLSQWKIKPIKYGNPLTTIPLGSFCLEDEQTLWASPACSVPYPDGKIPFEEDKSSPPSRAYLKLWEFFSRAGHGPQKEETCVDLGASPGGWTWVLARQGGQVVSVDKAALDPKIMRLQNVRYLSKDAFSILPGDLSALGLEGKSIDWLCSDIICYPPKLFEYVYGWLKSGKVKNFVITIKFQGQTDFETIAKFKAIPGSNTIHLLNNKHELTWSWLSLNQPK